MSGAASASAVPHGLSESRSLRVTLSGLMLVLAVSSLDANIVGPALPRILEEFGQVQHIAWVLVAFLITSTATTPLYGKLSDIYGRRPLFVTAIGLFLLGSMLSGLADSMAFLIIGRAVQGLGAGGLMTLIQITMSDLIAPDRRASYQGLFGAVFVGSSLLGPPAGGFLTQALSWRWIFYVNLPIGIAALVLVLGSLVDLPRTQKPLIDFRGAAIITAGTGSALLALSWGGIVFPWSSPVILLLGLLTVVLLWTLLYVERRSPAPVIALPLFANRTFTVASLLGLLISAAVTAALAFMPLFLQLAMGMSPTASGLLMTPMVGALMVALLGGGRAITRVGRYRRFVFTGVAVSAAALVTLALVVRFGGSFWQIGVLLAALGLGLGLVMPGVTVALQNAVEPAVIGTATATASFLRGVGNALAVAVAGAIVAACSGLSPEAGAGAASAAAAAPMGLRTGLGWTIVVAAVLTIVAVGIARLLPDIPLRKRPVG